MTATTIPGTRFHTVHGTRIRYVDSGGVRTPTILLTSPWPESLHAFTPVWATLAPHARLFAVDLPGFGHSERRDDLLSPRAGAARPVDDSGSVTLSAAAEGRASRRTRTPR